MMNKIFLLAVFVSSAYAYVEESALTSLQSLDHWNTFRIVISHTTDECFYLEAKLHDTIHVVYQVLKGGDSKIRAIIIDPVHNITYFNPKNEFGWYDEEAAKVAGKEYICRRISHMFQPKCLQGTYQICFKNEQYFATKYLYIGVLAVHKDRVYEASVNSEKEKRANETAVLDEFSTTIMTSLNDISGTLYRLTAYQTVARVQDIHDLYWVEANESYVQSWAICQIIAMILCSIIQVFSIRRLFKSRKLPKFRLDS
ncbi:unnamed protein product [Adineta ricciae]|uniref:GOLD domain-containing protein n=1 Tax=Adineta ricciae TaxID=249248 RepID=A0A813WI50_ADIRI|nr:unnamed protein product [Adineta ricciae]